MPFQGIQSKCSSYLVCLGVSVNVWVEHVKCPDRDSLVLLLLSFETVTVVRNFVDTRKYGHGPAALMIVIMAAYLGGQAQNLQVRIAMPTRTDTKYTVFKQAKCWGTTAFSWTQACQEP